MMNITFSPLPLITPLLSLEMLTDTLVSTFSLQNCIEIFKRLNNVYMYINSYILLVECLIEICIVEFCLGHDGTLLEIQVFLTKVGERECWHFLKDVHGFIDLVTGKEKICRLDKCTNSKPNRIS